MKVILNADDMGMSDTVNHSIIEMHQKGVVSSTSLMANGTHFNEAIELLTKHPRLGIGVHLCLDGPFQSATGYRTLIDPLTSSFYDKDEVVRRIRNSSLDKEEVFREFSLQVEKIQDHGVQISHLDTHHHLHLYFPILSQVIRVARKYNISFIRSQRLDTIIPKGRINNLYRNVHHLYLNMRLKSVRGYYDPAIQDCEDLEFNLARLKGLFKSLKGTTEIMLHPVGKDDPETLFFSSKEVLDLLSRQAIINYNQLKEQA